MLHRRSLFLLLVLGLAAGGCGKPDGSTEPSSNTTAAAPAGTTAEDAAASDQLAQLEAPAATVFKFLEAVRNGNDAQAEQLLSNVAREKVRETGRSVTPPASDTASFRIGPLRYAGEDGAWVSAEWTDVDEETHRPQTDESVWMVRKDEEGWRVVGVAAEVFEGEPPLVLNFEDPEEMLRKQQWLREELVRRARTAQLESQGGENPEKSIRR